MREGWEMKKLGEVCIVERGSSPRPIEKYQTTSTDGVNWIKIGDTKGVDKYIYTTKEKITKEGAEKSRYVKEGDFILSNSMSFGKPFIMKTDGYIHDGWFVFRLPDYLDKDFFYYLLTSPVVQEQIQGLGSGSVVKNISGDLVKKVDLVIPPLPEQQQIVAYLDQTFAKLNQAKANTLQNLKNAKELFETELQSIMENGKMKVGNGEWEEKKLKEIGITQTGNTPKTNEPDNYGDYIPFVKPPHFLKDGTIDTKDSFLSEKGLKNGRLFKENTILMVCIGATIGKTGFTKIPVSSNQQINGLTPKAEYDARFFYYAMISKYFQSKVMEEGKGAQATLPIINKSKWENLTIPFPKSLQTQQEIVAKLDALKTQTQALEASYQAKLNNLEELYSGILKRAFEPQLIEA